MRPQTEDLEYWMSVAVRHSADRVFFVSVRTSDCSKAFADSRESFARPNVVNEQRVRVRDHGVNFAALPCIRQGLYQQAVGFTHILLGFREKVGGFPYSPVNEIDSLVRRTGK